MPSPLPRKKSDADAPEELSFGEAMEKVSAGLRVRSLSWEPSHWLHLRGDDPIVHLHGTMAGKDGDEHVLVLRLADIQRSDWVVLR